MARLSQEPITLRDAVGIMAECFSKAEQYSANGDGGFAVAYLVAVHTATGRRWKWRRTSTGEIINVR